MKRIYKLFVLIILCSIVLPGCNQKQNNVKKEVKEQKEEKSIDEMSIEELREQSEADNADAAYRLGEIYDYGLQGVERNDALAIDYYKRARELGNFRASLALGYIYLTGAGVDKNLNSANEFFTEASDNGVNEALVGLARVLIDADNPDKNPEKAYEYFDQAAMNDSLDGMFYKNYLIEIGLGIEADPKAALLGYETIVNTKTEDINDSFAINQANTRLGLMYYRGIGCDKDFDRGIEYLKVASDAGFVQAQFYLGMLYEYGDEEHEPEYDEALSYYEAAASKNFAPALNQVGYFYCLGLSVDVNYEQAVYYQKLAAAQNYAPALANLGYLYENGLGCEKSIDTARQYYKMAAENGYDGAKSALVRLESIDEAVELINN